MVDLDKAVVSDQRNWAVYRPVKYFQNNAYSSSVHALNKKALTKLRGGVGSKLDQVSTAICSQPDFDKIEIEQDTHSTI